MKPRYTFSMFGRPVEFVGQYEKWDIWIERGGKKYMWLKTATGRTYYTPLRESPVYQRGPTTTPEAFIERWHRPRGGDVAQAFLYGFSLTDDPSISPNARTG